MADLRATLQRWVAGRLWMFATAGGAVAVFLITFAVVSALQGGDDEPVIPGLNLGSAIAQPPAASEPAPVVEDAAEAGAAPATTRPKPEEAESRDPPPRNVSLPAFDESLLILGNAGDHGAILGGPGIVDSSSLDRRTDWVLLIPSARIKAAIARVSLTASRAFGAPDNPYIIGWWEDGPAPGQPGNVLLDGHRDFTDVDDNQGAGVCWFLPDTQKGDFVIIRDNAREIHYLYTVREIASLAWNSEDGVAYLATSEESILTLVTCEGSFDEGSHNYSNRRILVAELTDSVTFEESNFEGDSGIYAGAAGSSTVRREDDAERDGEEDEPEDGGDGTTGDEAGEADGDAGTGDTDGDAGDGDAAGDGSDSGDAEGESPPETESGDPAPEADDEGDPPPEDGETATDGGGAE